MFRPRKDLPGNAGHEVFSLRYQLHIEPFGNIIESVPLNIVRTHHGYTVTCTTALMMPEIEIYPVKRFIEWSGVQFVCLFELVNDIL